MKILDLEQAAEFLSKMNPEVLRRHAAQGKIPGKKVAGRWLFVDVHLADWISYGYSDAGRELRVIDGGKQTKEVKQPCQSISGEKTKRGGFSSPHPKASAYSALLGLKTGVKPKSSTTNSRPKAGE